MTQETNSEFDRYKEKIKKSLLKKALGYRYNEVIEEYSVDEDGEKLTKRKVTTKDVPPDMSAVKMLLDSLSVEHNDFENMSDNQLKQEIENAIKLLELKYEGENDGTKET